MNKLFSIYKSERLDKNPHIIFTFPTSNGQNTDILNFNVLESLLGDNVLIFMIQTQDYNCFYDPMIGDHRKIMNLSDFFQIVDTIFNNILVSYETIHKPLLLGCSMGGYYAQMCFLMHPNRFNCISLGGMCDISVLDKNNPNTPWGDRVINYYNFKQYWDQYNPVAFPIKEKLHTRLIACFGTRQDGFLMERVYEFHNRIETWNYIKMYDLGHSFDAWREMATDIFKGTSQEFHDFRQELWK